MGDKAALLIGLGLIVVAEILHLRHRGRRRDAAASTAQSCARLQRTRGLKARA